MGLPKRPRDPAELADFVGRMAIGELANDKDAILNPPKPSVKVKAANARAANLSPERRAEIARLAAAARWNKAGTPTAR